MCNHFVCFAHDVFFSPKFTILTREQCIVVVQMRIDHMSDSKAELNCCQLSRATSSFVKGELFLFQFNHRSDQTPKTSIP